MTRILRAPVGGGRVTTPRLPPHQPGMAIGLFGGSFNPPHDGHRRASLMALKRLGLDRVWWLVTPGNPLKDNVGLPPLEKRMAAARAVAAHPQIVVSDVEAAIGVRYTYDAVSYLVRRCPDVSFVWLMGADNLGGFHRWERWGEIAGLLPICVVDRPGATFTPSSPAAKALSPYRLPERDAALLPGAEPPVWCFLHGPRSPLSSTMLRGKKAGAGDT